MRKLLTIALLLFAPMAFAADSTTFTYGPLCGHPQYSGDFTWNNSPDGEMWCQEWIPCVGITNLTQIAFRMGNTDITTSPEIGVAIYNMSGSYLAKGTVAVGNTDENQIKIVSSLTFSGADDFTAGTQYMICWCSDETSGAGDFAGNNVTGTIMDDFVNAFTTGRQGTAANTCNTTTAVPPDTMGSDCTPLSDCLTAEVGINAPIFKFGTASP